MAAIYYNLVFAETSSCRWKCIIGNVKRWKSGLLSLYNPDSDPAVSELCLKAELIARDNETSVIEFSWEGGIPFSTQYNRRNRLKPNICPLWGRVLKTVLSHRKLSIPYHWE